ncbi:hypothetical protein CVT25_007331 [Psilocybe cyanescens]|uniref:Chitin synthase n=1 Tax=Psilocybe cyanescens TaxID=93625 RepID=A0A409XJF3_PSICY|nr:hypothetical protein CVT25_007331 [Psilocybe cyanescens]
MRYSAVTYDPNAFKDSGFALQQAHYDPPRRTELFIVMTMYNEHEELSCRTMHGGIKNVAHLCKRDRTKTWGKDAWKKEGGCVHFSATPSLKIEGAEKGTVPVQVIFCFCLNEKNQKTINSHCRFVNAFGAVSILQPNLANFTCLHPSHPSLPLSPSTPASYSLPPPHQPLLPSLPLHLLVPQNSSPQKKTNSESVFGYTTVLPSAFGVYCYITLLNDAQGEGPLQKYFLGETMVGFSCRRGANGYTPAMLGFSVTAVYMTVAVFLLAFRDLENLAHTDRPLKFSDIFTNPTFRNIVVSLLATRGLYVISSIIFFANVHDISWGTKGDNTVAKVLGTVATSKKAGEVEAEVPKDEKDINALYSMKMRSMC